MPWPCCHYIPSFSIYHDFELNFGSTLCYLQIAELPWHCFLDDPLYQTTRPIYLILLSAILLAQGQSYRECSSKYLSFSCQKID